MKLGLKIFISLLLIFFSFSARAKEQNNFNLYLTNWTEFKDIPLYYQSGFAACYAYSTSQLSEFYLRQSGQLTSNKKHVSPFWLSYIFKTKSSHPFNLVNLVQPSLEHGIGKPTFKVLEEVGLCNSEIIDNNLKKLGLGTQFEPSDIVALFEIIWNSKGENPDKIFNKIKISKQFWKIYRSFVHSKIKVVKEVNENNLDKKISFEIINKMILSFKDYLEKYKEFNLFDTYFNVFLDGCEKTENIRTMNWPKMYAKGQLLANDKKIREIIKNGFIENDYSQPVQIGYCANVYKELNSTTTIKKHKKLSPRILERTLTKNTECSAHYSLIVGQRQNPDKSIDYLIRNSYGNWFMPVSKGCFCRNEITQQFEDCGQDEENPIYADKNKQLLGCWVDSDKIINTIYDINYFNKE